MHPETLLLRADPMLRNPAAASHAHLRDLVDETLRRAAAAMSRNDTPDSGVRDLILCVCNAAHERSLRAEQLLVLLKAAWKDLPEAWPRKGQDSPDVLARVITACVHEYYARGVTAE